MQNSSACKVPEGFPKAFPFRGMHFFASIEKVRVTFLVGIGLLPAAPSSLCNGGWAKSWKNVGQN